MPRNWLYAIAAIVFLVLSMDVAAGMMLGCIFVDTGMRDRLASWAVELVSKEK